MFVVVCFVCVVVFCLCVVGFLLFVVVVCVLGVSWVLFVGFLFLSGVFSCGESIHSLNVSLYKLVV